MGNLVESAKQQIRNEEVFREEIRRELENARPPRSTWQQIFSFLNTNVGLWLLTTVAFGAILRCYEVWKEERESRLARTELIRKLDVEIAFRLSAADSKLRDTAKADAPKTALQNLVQPEFVQAAFPEFRERGLGSLLFELHGLVSSDEESSSEERSEVMRAYRAADSLRIARMSDTTVQLARDSIPDLFPRKRWYQP